MSCKKALKISGTIIGCILVFLLLLLVSTPLWLGPVVKGVANSMVPKMTGTEFNIGSLSVNPLIGRVSVGDFRLANPVGYDPDTAVSFTSLDIDFDIASVFSDVIHFRKISLDDFYVSYVSADGVNNFDRISSNVSANTSKGEASEAKSDEKPVEASASNAESSKNKKDIKVAIDTISISGTKVKLSVLPAIPIPSFSINNIGKTDDGEVKGATFKEVCEDVWNSIQKAISNTGSFLSKGFGKSSKKLGDGAGDLLKAVGDLLK